MKAILIAAFALTVSSLVLLLTLNVTANTPGLPGRAGSGVAFAAQPASGLSFAPFVPYAVQSGPYSVAVGNFNGDALPDIVATNSASNTVSVLLNSGSGGFGAATSYAVNNNPQSVAVGDFNEDNHPDLVVATTFPIYVAVLLNNGNGTFAAPQNYSVLANPNDVAVGDFNGDHHLDIVTANSAAAGVVLILGDGHGSFGAPHNFQVPSGANALAVGNFNGDAFLDLAVAGNQNGGMVSVLLGNGLGGFSAPVTYAVAAAPDGVAVGDFNHDGHPDLAVATFDGAALSVLLGTGSGTFGAAINYPVASGLKGVAVADFDGDGKLDLVTAVYGNLETHYVAVVLGNGSGGFGAPQNFLVDPAPDDVAVGDFNGDGKPDVVSSNFYGNNVSVLRNTSGQQTATPTRVPTQTPGGPTATPTACTIMFSDVPPSNPFYSYIQCLACRGIVGGYTTSPPCTSGTPCFLPGNNVTRGQMAKFISNAAGYQDVIPPNQQTFTDVMPNSTFWQYVERVHLHGVVAGYTTSPPCTTGTPCFLPGNNVTRGQTAKFVSISAGYQDVIPPNQQTFTDVMPNSTFWQYVERVHLHGVVGGYTTSPPCTTGTPCFLPGNSVTRGQTAKFLSNAFFPNCQTPSRP